MSPDDLVAFRLCARAREAETIPVAAGGARGRTGGGWTVRRHVVEVMRAVASVVRDRDRGTAAPVVRDIDARENAAGFSVAYRPFSVASLETSS